MPLTPGARAPGLASPPDGPVPGFTDLTSSGLSPITSALIAAAVATVVVWIGGKLRREALTRGRQPARAQGCRPAAQTRRRTLTTRPRMVASSPGIGS